jgi:hypothetical protein
VDEQMDQLCRRVAELKPNWALPGMACLDAETKSRWRMHALGQAAKWASEVHYTHIADVCGYWAAQARAIASGPNWRDPVTCLGLLALLPDVRIDQQWGTDPDDGKWKRLRWWVGPDRGGINGSIAATREEAILRAVVAHLEAAP